MADVMVFSPTPQLTVTIEDSDGDEVHFHAGGQGVWQARMINSLEVDVVLCCALGGESGLLLGPLIGAEGIRVRSVAMAASNGVYVHDRRDGERREVADQLGEPLTRHEQDELYGLALAEGLKAKVCLLSGVNHPDVMPPDMYRRLAGDLRRNHCTVVADLSGDYLRAALEGGLDVVKVSHEELLDSGLSDGSSEAELVPLMKKLRSEGARTVIVSRAERPALALTGDRVVRVSMPTLEAADHRGAGDSMTAGVAAVLASGGDVDTAIRTGAAAGAVNVTRRGLGTGRADVIAALRERVELTPVESMESQESDHTSPEELAEKSKVD
ncbi:MAG TPA: PfkB family carbohydrate kinase [Candidatus Limnocylindrales bacterium]